jgi:hypothetical protein
MLSGRRNMIDKMVDSRCQQDLNLKAVGGLKKYGQNTHSSTYAMEIFHIFK